MSNEFVTLTREVVEQAIEALEKPRSQQSWYQRSIDDTKAATALRAALEQSGVEPVAWMLEDGVAFETASAGYHCGAEWTPLYTNPQPAQQPEANKLLRQALEAMEVQGSEWVILEQNAIAAIRKYLGEA